MENASDRIALKREIVDKIMSLEEAELATAQAHYDAFMQDAQLDGREEHDKDDIVGARENMDLAAAFDHPVQAHHAKIDALENMDFSTSSEVAPGAVVHLNGRRLVVAVSTAQFEAGGATYMGISTQSPIYKAMAGCTAGDSFVFNGETHTIEDVF